VDHCALDLRRWETPDCAGLSIPFQHVGRDVIAIEFATLARMSRRHGPAGRAEYQALEQRRRLRPGAGGTLSRVLTHDGVHSVPEGAIEDGLMLPGISRALVNGLSHVDPVVEQLVDVTLVDQLALLSADALRAQ